MARITDKEAARLSGWSKSWLRSHTCGWCGQSIMQAVKGNCGEIGIMRLRGEKCDGTKWYRDTLLKKRAEKAATSPELPPSNARKASFSADDISPAPQLDTNATGTNGE